MANLWDSYYIVFLGALISLGIPLLLYLTSLVFSPKSHLETRSPAMQSQYHLPVNNRVFLGKRVNVRFFIGANAAMILLALLIMLIPCVTSLESPSDVGLRAGLIGICTIAGFAVLGLFYSVRKGDMSWYTTFNQDEKG